MQRKLEAAFIVLLVFSSFSLAYAFLGRQPFGATLTVTNPVKVFSDASCTVAYGATISLGSAPAGQGVDVFLYVQDVSNSALTLYWNSTLPNTGSIIDHWYIYITASAQPMNATMIQPTTCYKTFYGVGIFRTTPLGSYSWTVNLGYV